MTSGERERAHANAYKLRAEGLSIREIAARLDVPRGTVGQWLRGVGERVLIGECELCGDRFVSERADRRFCCGAHGAKYKRVFGPPSRLALLIERARALEAELRPLRARLAGRELEPAP